MPTKQLYYHFLFGPRGKRAARSCAPGANGAPRLANGAEGHDWHLTWDVKMQVHPDRWTAELKIPLGEMKVTPGKGSVWRVNVARQRVRPDGPVETSAVQSLTAGFHDHGRFSTLRFD